MSLLQNSNAISTGSDYNLESSLRLRGSANGYLSRTPTVTGNTRTFTLSTWFKLGVAPDGSHCLLSCKLNDNNRDGIGVVGGYLRITNVQDGLGVVSRVSSAAELRDPSAWYHLIVAVDTTQATASDRVKLYINGVDTGYSQTDYPSLNEQFEINRQQEHRIGFLNYSTPSWKLDGYLTEYNFIDGQQLTPSDFGETDSTTGVWKPKQYTGTYGTNGFYLPMKETQQATGFNTVLYTGNGGTQSITGVGFSPDLVWTKSRDSNVNANHAVSDTVRGVGSNLFANDTNAESFPSNGTTSFDSDGWQIGSNLHYNRSGDRYVSWCWDAGSSTVSNTDGSITSSVRANPDYGFSIVTYTGNATNSTVGHGLGVTPSMIIVKCRDNTQNWGVWHKDLSSTAHILQLNTTSAELNRPNFFNSGSHSSTTFNLGTDNATNDNGSDHVAYCFSEVAGFSKFGSYTGNGSTSGPTVTTGFKPAWIMFKRSDNANGWYIWDNTRTVNNPRGNFFKAETSDAENSADIVNFTDTGFEIISNSSAVNTSGGTYIYMAFADTRDAQFNFDASGNKNNWTPNNINSNASSETTYDIMNDVPTLTDEDTGNFATMNPISASSTTIDYTNGNLTVKNTGSGGNTAYPTIENVIGNWYVEMTVESTGSNYARLGITLPDAPVSATYRTDGLINDFTGSTTNVASYTTGDTVAIYIDVSANTYYYYKNGTQVFSETNSNIANYGSTIYTVTATNWKVSVNFGQRPFKYTPPTGYKKLNTYNLPDSTIVDGSQYMNTVLYTGNGTSQSITGVGFSPDLVWTKSRDDGGLSHRLFDSVRGATNLLYSNLTNAETTASGITSFDSDGFTVGSNAGNNAVNDPFVSWNWRASDSSAVSNTDGTITSTVSANTTSGFSVVTYTGNSTAGSTVGHGLNAKPDMILLKSRSDADNWRGYHSALGATKDIILNSTSGASTNSSRWNNTEPTSSVFTIGIDDGVNENGDSFVAYLFSGVEGFSKFGSYTGNGSADGPFVYTGFRPAFVMIKRTNTSGNWVIVDTARNTYNDVDLFLIPNLSNAEGTVTDLLDFYSNGFKLRVNASGTNTSGDTYAYMAFAENPFKHSLAR